VKPEIKARYTDAIRHDVMARYSIAGLQVRELDGFESFIYEFERDGGAYILRVGHSLRRSAEMIHGEIDWINFLAAGGASVAKAVPSENGNLVEVVEDAMGDSFLATAFVKAEGKPAWQGSWGPPLFETYGALLGRMHALSKRYEPPDPAWRRPHWDDLEMIDIEEWLPPSETGVRERYYELMEHLNDLPRDSGAYGLIHQDAHAGNFFVDEGGKITLFDFDDCAYSWYMNDIGIALFYAVMGEEDEAAFTREFMGNFLHGYRRESEIDVDWLPEIEHFLKLREIDLYAVIHRSFDVDHLEDHPWVARFMDGRKERIEGGVPFIEFDFTSLMEVVSKRSERKDGSETRPRRER
jgi:Ser/Thr protein kinase RdoA (MazF antagonist)